MSKRENEAAKVMTEAMDETMQRLHERFQAISEQLEGQIDEMGTRISGLERNVTELMTEAGMEDRPVSKMSDLLPN
ncbi:heat shock factor-binding protein 1-like protein 1 [Nerophis ophidion]|uniref:heat shock factor-binding protein 1-like protein 1 n=1 Tax=Nerophis ophidion TaxID=159077 RepID=UPI002AE08ABE|nr:heat shock factor-binding protein 1-like protein 1 [Nerophis ophidion]